MQQNRYLVTIERPVSLGGFAGIGERKDSTGSDLVNSRNAADAVDIFWAVHVKRRCSPGDQRPKTVIG